MKFIYLAVVQLVKQAWLIPQSLSNAIKQWQRRKMVNELEVERLDRIRNPDKYRGK